MIGYTGGNYRPTGRRKFAQSMLSLPIQGWRVKVAAGGDKKSLSASILIAIAFECGQDDVTVE